MRHLMRCAVLAGITLAAGGAVAQDACPLAALGTAQISTVQVAAVRDGRTLALRDGRELRLAAIETPTSAQSDLAAIAADKTLTLKRLGTDTDRYGRVVAFAFPADAPASLQQSLLEAGAARVAARVGDKACADALLTTEAAARAAKRGLWADPNFAPLPADHTTEIAAKRGQFVLVEGKVLSVHESGGTIYLNFARRWSKGFSAAIATRARRQFAAAGVEPKQLEGKPIRVRGWIEQRSGPLIEAAAPEQIELIH
jgi:endonuclease YncB( thermonuclease family)